MGQLVKLTILLFFLNTFLYLGLGFAQANGLSDDKAVRLSGDMFDIYLQDKDSFFGNVDEYFDSVQGKNNITRTITIDPNQEWTQPPDETSAEAVSASTTGFTFLDGLRITYAFVKTLFNIALVPLTLFTTSIFPPLFAMLLGIPLGLIYTILLIAYIRSGAT